MDIFIGAAIFIWVVVLVLTGVIFWLGLQPGHRRRRQDPNYIGLERRASTESVDLVNKPIMNSDEINRRRILSITDSKSCPKDCPYYNTKDQCPDHETKNSVDK